jgi:uncharacterized protein involved in outer membrane biogenesis
VHPSTRRWLAGVALLVLAIVVGVVITAAIYLPRASELVRERVIAQLNSDLESEVDVESLQMSLRPSPRVVLQGLVMRHKGRRDVPPLVQIRSLTADLSLSGWWAHRLDRVRIEGLRIFIPPRSREGGKPADTESEDGAAPEQPRGATAAASGWFIDRLMATDATLSKLSKDERLSILSCAPQGPRESRRRSWNSRAWWSSRYSDGGEGRSVAA